MRAYEPSPDELREGVKTLEAVAADASKAIKSIEVYARRISSLPARIQQCINSTSTGIDSTLQGEVRAASGAITNAIDALVQAERQAKQQADELRRRAAAAERR